MHRWAPGRVLVFDDSYLHEAWFSVDDPDTDAGADAGADIGYGTDTGTAGSWRLVLIVDFWHPQLSAVQRAALDVCPPPRRVTIIYYVSFACDEGSRGLAAATASGEGTARGQRRRRGETGT